MSSIDQEIMQARSQLKTLQQKCQLQNKKIKLFRKQNEELKNGMVRQTQTDTSLLLSSKELSDANDRIQVTLAEMRKHFDEEIDRHANTAAPNSHKPNQVTVGNTTVHPSMVQYMQ